MAILKRRPRAVGGIPTASMADIAFLLLIFFLVTTVFEDEKGLPVVLPEKTEEVQVPEGDVLQIMIRSDGNIEIKRGEDPSIQRALPGEIASIWREEAARNANLIAAVRTEPAAPYKHMIAVLDQLEAAGAERISLQVLEDRP